MKKELNYIFTFIVMLASFSIYAQKEAIIGLWEVEKVTLGKKNKTPISKWFRVNANGTYQTGNGWLQNGSGNWNYDVKDKIYTATDSLDVTDEFGGFTLSFDDQKMIWERKEKGMVVKVTLQPINKLPMSPADYLKGIWDLVEITENGQSIINDFDKENKHKLFIGWDRVYINFSPEGKKLRGYWHIHGHRPEITLLPHQSDRKPKRWKVQVNAKELLMKGISESNQTIQRKYVRRNNF